MKISSLITELNELLSQYGDLHVRNPNGRFIALEIEGHETVFLDNSLDEPVPVKNEVM